MGFYPRTAQTILEVAYEMSLLRHAKRDALILLMTILLSTISYDDVSYAYDLCYCLL